ncbi:unnamed protein product [Coregonus sp. 'balchen']|nr:unnamed protein product [Coregonus sp. 'balchen']
MVLGKVKSFTVSYDCLNDSNVPVFASGDSVSGRVIIEVTGEIRVKSLKIQAKGFAKVRWTESRNAGSNTAYTQNYTEEVEYLNHRDILIGHERDEDNSEEGLTTIHSGRHEYAFSLELPQTPLATSFEGKHGSVRYWVKAELHRPWLLPMKTKKEFTSPQAGTKDKTLCCWFCTSGPISLSAKIERKGYTPGESIQIFAEIENCSSRMVVPKAAIYQTQTFKAKGKLKEVKQLVANLRGESLSSGKTETWSGKMLKIPPVSPSILDCSIIQVEYSLMVYVDIPGAMNLSLNLPLVMGTIPLHPFGSRTSSVSSQCSMTMSWLGMALPERPEAPPSYAEIVTEEQRQSLVVTSARDELEGPLFAYIQEFRFQPPPLYSELVNIFKSGSREVPFQLIPILIKPAGQGSGGLTPVHHAEGNSEPRPETFRAFLRQHSAVDVERKQTKKQTWTIPWVNEAPSTERGTGSQYGEYILAACLPGWGTAGQTHT